jgi:hypothetical protein
MQQASVDQGGVIGDADLLQGDGRVTLKAQNLGLGVYKSDCRRFTLSPSSSTSMSFLSSITVNICNHRSISSTDAADSLNVLAHITEDYTPLFLLIQATDVVFQ